MDTMKTHGAFSWSELMTSDPKAALGFYTALFGWNVQSMDMPQGSYHVVRVGASGTAPMMPPTGVSPTRTTW